MPERKLVFEVGGMTCGHCAARVESELADQPGVLAATVDLAAEEARVVLGDGADPGQLESAVSAIGYELRLAGEAVDG